VGIGVPYARYYYVPAYRYGHVGYLGVSYYGYGGYYGHPAYAYVHRPYPVGYYLGPTLSSYYLSAYPYYHGYTYVYPRYTIVQPTYGIVLTPAYDDYYRSYSSSVPVVRDVVRGATPTTRDEPLSQPRPTMQRATVRVILPAANAQVSFDGANMGAAGRDRTFNTPALETGRLYSYSVTVVWSQNGQSLTETRKVNVQAGQTSVVDFTQPATIPVPPTPQN